MARIVLGGKERELKYTFGASRRLKKEQGINMYALDIKKDDPLDPELMVGMLWAALLHEDPKLTIDQAAALIEPFSILGDVAEAVGEAVQEYVQPETDLDPTNAPPGASP